MFEFFKRNKGTDHLFFQTDVHSHMCPGIDDGARNTRHALGLIEQMHELGIRKMIITPHVTDETFPNTPEIISKAFDKISNAVSSVGMDMQLDYSAEYRIDDLLFTYLKEGIVRPMPNDYILVENSWIQEPFGLDSFLFNLQSEYGLKPILAHPERYQYYQPEKNRYKMLNELGILFQVNLLSLSGYYGKPSKQVAEWLLDNNYVDFIGSDLHHSAHIEAIKRYINTKDYKKLTDKAKLIKNDIAFE